MSTDTKPTSLAEIEARAQRCLDGMTVNKEAMAKDVLRLVAGIRAIQAKSPGVVQGSGSFADTFGEMLSDIFGTNKT